MTLREFFFSCSKYYKNYILQRRKNNPLLYQFTQKREWPIALFFALLISIILLRLFILQIIDFKEYDQKIASNHNTSSELKAQR